MQQGGEPMNHNTHRRDLPADGPFTPGADYLLELNKLTVAYGNTQVLHDVSLTLVPGETVAVVGQSGSGKSTLISAVLGLLVGSGKVTGGTIAFRGKDMTRASEAEMHALRGNTIAFVPQDPMSNLSPTMKVGEQIADAVRAHHRSLSKHQVIESVVRLMTEAGIPEAERRRKQYPHEFSGGMRQRVLIAMALAGDPDLLIADEPTSALDVTVQKQILDHLGQLVKDRGMSLLFITHDLGVAADRTDTVIVMHQGRVVERGPASQVLRAPQEAYTKALVAASPSLDVRHRDDPVDIPAEKPAPVLSVQDVVKTYKVRGTGGTINAVDGVSFDVRRGLTTAIIGESGSGKSTLAKIALGLESVTSGDVIVDGTSVKTGTREEMKRIRRFSQPVFQDPYSSLNPTFSIERIISEPLDVFKIGDRAARRKRVEELLDQVALPRSIRDARPGELSGGQRQRVAIARAMSSRPELLVCDEAVSALDVLVQQQVLELLRTIQQEQGVSILFITHDLGVVADFAHDTVVMRRGKVVEFGDTHTVITRPSSSYTQELIAAVPGEEALSA